MPVDPQIQVLLDLRAALPPMHTLSVEEARIQMGARAIPGLRIPEVASVVNRDMQGPGGSLPLRIYTPKGTGPFPLMVFFHGSGFVVCSLDTHDAMCRNLCAGTGSVVVSGVDMGWEGSRDTGDDAPVLEGPGPRAKRRNAAQNL